jgi:DNA-binding NarL/FixJ family response regulator
MQIIVADKQELICEGIKTIVSKLGKHSVLNIPELLLLEGQLRNGKIELVIIDFDQCWGVTAATISEIMAYNPSTKLMVLTNNETDEAIVQCLEAGVDGYLLKSCSKAEFLESFEGIFQDKKMYCQPVLKVLCNQYINIKQKKNEPEQISLTAQETKITELTSWGLTAKEIADKLNIRIHTVNTHRKNIFKKIGVKNSSELVMYAVRKGIIDSTEYYI